MSRKQSLINDLLRMTGLEDALEDQHKRYYQVFTAKYSDIPSDVFDDLYEQHGVKEYRDNLNKLYNEIFTEQDLEEIIKFYASPIGSKLCKKDTLNKIRRLQESWHIRLEKLFFDKNESLKNN